MKQILFPYDKNQSGKGYNHIKPSAWESLNPLQMAEKIAKMVETDPEIRIEESLQISTAYLAYEHPNDISMSPSGSGTVPSATAAKVDDNYITDICTSKTSRNKRSISGFQVHSKEGNLPIPAQMIDGSEKQLMPWDLSFILTYNPNDTTAKLAVKELASLAEKLESRSAYNVCCSSYKRLRDSLFEETRLIFEEEKPDQQKSISFGHLYSDAIQQMKALLYMAEKVEVDQKQTNEAQSDGHKGGLMRSKSDRSLRDSDLTGSSKRPVVRRVYEKKTFTEYMNRWLIQNWTNPYPDDEGLEELAEMNGTTVTIVSNWLINARTRKWRPAIVKAYEYGRPADLLKEDSIEIFKGQPIRRI